MDLSALPDKGIIKGLYENVIAFHNTLRAEYIAKHILEEFGIYHEVSLYQTFENLGEAYLEEAEKRNLDFSLRLFKYGPSFNIDMVINIIKKIALDSDQKEMPLFLSAIKYTEVNADKILNEGLVKKIN